MPAQNGSGRRPGGLHCLRDLTLNLQSSLPADKKFGFCYVEYFRGCCVTVRRPKSQMDAHPRCRLSWQAAVVVVGLTLTLSWAVFLAYEFIKLVTYAI